ncbi:glycosyltransferase family 4 protein [Methyloglobulus sp.]|uniref:glycosyltransferase family 4 protein n=1 Tax=Methyloglobulus sp. TaxID=2518622 RepID=UPI001825E4DD|nr:glycosyltransferase family 4 protein [Methyloglobulus sp.]
MKITFVVPTLNLSGGLRVVAVYAKLLTEKGHEVSVVSPNRRKATLKERLKSLIKWRGFVLKKSYDSTFFDSPLVNLVVLDKYRPVEANDIDDGDILIATFWNTAEWIADFPTSKGKKIYFIQHYETHPWLPVERVKATLKQPFKKIVVSQWIADILAYEFGDNDVVVAPNGVDTQQFHSPKRDKQPIPTIGTIYSPRSFKGFDVALEAFNMAKKFIPNLKLVIFGSEQPSQTVILPQDTSYHLRPNQSELSKHYGLCDAWLFSSRSEGYGLPILEAMACRTPVIGTRAGAAPELINQTNGFLLEIDDVPAMANAIIAVAEMPNEQWLQLSQNAYEASLKHTWSEAFSCFEQALLQYANTPER